MKWCSGPMVLAAVAQMALALGCGNDDGGNPVRIGAQDTLDPAQCTGDAGALLLTIQVSGEATMGRDPSTPDQEPPRPYFSPNGDGVNDFLHITFDLESSTAVWDGQVDILNTSGGLLRALRYRSVVGSYEVLWDGRDDNGDLLPAGTYVVRATATLADGHTCEHRRTILSLSDKEPTKAEENEGCEQRKAIEDIFTSKSEMEASMNRVGTATGSQFSGTYSVVFQNGRFSTDCSVDFVRKHDIYVDTGDPDEQIQNRIEECFEDHTASIQVTQNDGRVIIDSSGDGIESPLRGWVNADGAFQALIGQYNDNRNLGVAVYNGKFTGGNIEGELIFQVKLLDDPNVPGSCSVRFEFSGGK